MGDRALIRLSCDPANICGHLVLALSPVNRIAAERGICLGLAQETSGLAIVGFKAS
jgi:hypothetical protein